MSELQRTEQWYADRAGKATASRFADVQATLRGGGEAASRKNYRAQLVVERLTNERTDGYESTEMRWGTDTEPLARLAFQLGTGLDVEEVGFLPHETLAAGASPDGLIGRDATLEIKCPNTATHIETLAAKNLPARYVAQVQGQLWITGRSKCYFVSYDPRMPKNARLRVIEVPRDNDYIDTLQEEVIEFLAEVDRETAFVRSYGEQQ